MSPQRDSISSLPDEVLGKVLSLLPTNQAASTLVLSKRWRNLLSLVDSLDLSDDATATGDPRGFPDFVDKTLALLTNSSIIKRFSLRCEHTHDASRVDNWIRTVLERRSFSELHLESEYIHVIETKSLTCLLRLLRCFTYTVNQCRSFTSSLLCLLRVTKKKDGKWCHFFSTTLQT